jgi:serine/threonine protein kinase
MIRQDIAHYRIASLLGAGGMGQVYLAQDLKLGRRVALKLLPPETSSNENARKRLIREARAAATLDHPNICSVYEVGEDNGCSFIAMQYLEGETLDRLLKNGPLPLKETLSIATQIAEALAEAHSHGIVHRDIKPANIMIVKGSRVKVMDFGLAKTTSPSNPVDSEIQTETLMTTPGTVIGTVPYMSPEQVKGEIVDPRSDVFSFGVVIYEMLTGHQPFIGKTNAETISAILTRELPSLIEFTIAPAELQRIVRKCLNKEREQRYQSTRDLAIDLNNLKLDNTANATPFQVKRYPSRLYIGALVAALVALAGIGIYLLVSRWTSKSQNPLWSNAQTVATQLTNYGGTEGAGALSPDGKSFVFISAHGGTPDLWLRQIAGGEPVRLTHDADEEQDPIYAPDGETIYFTRVEKTGPTIWRMGVLGGQARRIVSGGSNPSPSRDGRSLAYFLTSSSNTGVDLNVMSVDGGNVRQLAKAIEGFAGPASWSPDGRWLSYTRGGLFAPSNLFIIEVNTGKERQVSHFVGSAEGIGAQIWLPDNRHLLVSYTPQQASFQNDLEVLDSTDGSLTRLTMNIEQSFTALSSSADGTRVIATATQNRREVWKVPLGPNAEENGRNAVRLLDSSQDPMWTYVSRDGRTLLFNNATTGSRNLWTMPLDGSVPARQITAIAGYNVMHSSLSPDGTRVAFVSRTTGNSDIWTQNVDGSDLRQLTNDAAADAWPVWSPNGEWIVFGSLNEGRWETKRIPASGGVPEKVVDGFFRGDLISQPDGKGTWLVTWIAGTGGIRLIDFDQHKVIWEERFERETFSLPMFSRDGRFISLPRAETSDRDAIWLYETATGRSRLAAKFSEPFQMGFRACWVDDGHALIVNRIQTISHVVLLDRFWQKLSPT